MGTVIFGAEETEGGRFVPFITVDMGLEQPLTFTANFSMPDLPSTQRISTDVFNIISGANGMNNLQMYAPQKGEGPVGH